MKAPEPTRYARPPANTIADPKYTTTTICFEFWSTNTDHQNRSLVQHFPQRAIDERQAVMRRNRLAVGKRYGFSPVLYCYAKIRSGIIELRQKQNKTLAMAERIWLPEWPLIGRKCGAFLDWIKTGSNWFAEAAAGSCRCIGGATSRHFSDAPRWLEYVFISIH